MPYTTRLALNIISVYPSGAACAASSAAMLPLAPARLSTTTLCPRAAVRGVATRRETKSRPPPAPEETIILIGLIGYVVPRAAAADCAAPCGAAMTSMAPSAAATLVRNLWFISPPDHFEGQGSRVKDQGSRIEAIVDLY